MKNNIHGDCCQHHVVYRYECPEPGCGPSQQYIGYTVTSTKQRATTHAQNRSIKHHHQSQHSQKIRAKDIEDRMTTSFRSPSKIDLTIAEALHKKKTHHPSTTNERTLGFLRFSDTACDIFTFVIFVVFNIYIFFLCINNILVLISQRYF